jgi:hypothetical protein
VILASTLGLKLINIGVVKNVPKNIYMTYSFSQMKNAGWSHLAVNRLPLFSTAQSPIIPVGTTSLLLGLPSGLM